MKIYVNMKKMGKRRNSVERVEYELPNDISSTMQLICSFVELLAEQYNQSTSNAELMRTLTQAQIEDSAASGRVSFGVNYNGGRADIEQAKQNALQCFEDGLYRIFLGNSGNPTPLADLNQQIKLNEGDELTFVRLTFLTGRMW